MREKREHFRNNDFRKNLKKNIETQNFYQTLKVVVTKNN